MGKEGGGEVILPINIVIDNQKTNTILLFERVGERITSIKLLDFGKNKIGVELDRYVRNA